MTQIPSDSSSLPLTIIAKPEARPGKEQEVFGACPALPAPTRAEEGCLTYGLHRSTEDPATVGQLSGRTGPGLRP